MGQFRDLTIKSVIEEINQRYFLPDIQREYVWLSKPREKKIEQLFDSILRGYPIGSFLFWKLKKTAIETNKDAKERSDKLNFQLYKFLENYDERKIHNEKVNIEQVNSDELQIVLDGQQRLTSLYIGLKGTRTLKRPNARRDNPNNFEEKKLYVNLRYQPELDSPDDNYEFDFLKPTNIPKNDESNYWFKVGDILTMGSIIGYVKENDLNDFEGEILEKLRDAFCVRYLISFFEETEMNLDKVLKIFIRVNSGGTQLDYSDLLMSILTANFSSDIRDLMNKFVDSIGEQGFERMKRDPILKTCLILIDSNHIFRLKNFSKNNINKIEENWDKITETIYSSINLLKEFGYTNRLSSAYIISAIAYYLFRNGTLKEGDKNEILNFIRNAQITSYFTTSLDTTLDTVVKAIRKSSNFKEINEALKANKTNPLSISQEDVKGMVDVQYSNPAALPILQILYPHLDFKNSTFHIDHIYPKSKFKSTNKLLPKNYYDKANSLFNLQLLQGDENISKKAKDPEIWIDEHFDNPTKIKDYKTRNYIDVDFKLDWDKIEAFEEMRTPLLLDKLQEVFGYKKNKNEEGSD